MSAAVLCVVVAAGWLVVCCFCVVLLVRVSVESSQGLNFLAFTPTNKRAATKNTLDKRLDGSDSARVNKVPFYRPHKIEAPLLPFSRSTAFQL
jgi:hypothetical protein